MIKNLRMNGWGINEGNLLAVEAATSAVTKMMAERIA